MISPQRHRGHGDYGIFHKDILLCMEADGISKRLINDICYSVIGAAIEVHKELGPGLLESIYEECLCEELLERGIKFKRQAKLPLLYKNKIINKTLYLDILVEDLVVIELKAVDSLLPIHEAQLLTYLKLAKKPKGLLINFNVDNISKTLVPLVSEYFEKLE